MFITDDQLRERLASSRNLANRFRNGKEIRNGTSGLSEGFDSSCEEISNEDRVLNEGPQGISQEGIQLREIKRPGNNRPWLSKSERTRIATDVATQTLNAYQTRSEIAKTYGVAPSTVTDIANKTRRIEGGPRAVDQAKVDLELDAVREKAIDRLMSGLGQLTEEKVAAHNGKDISQICANMAKVVQQTIPQEKGAQAINLIVYSPELRNEKHYDVIEVE